MKLTTLFYAIAFLVAVNNLSAQEAKKEEKKIEQAPSQVLQVVVNIKDIAGKTIVFEGNAKTKTTSVDELRHYAEDAGKSKDEIAKITEAKTELAFEANGVLVPKN